MNVSILIATFGHTRWQHLARTHAFPSAFPSTQKQVASEVLMRHEAYGTLASCRNQLADQATGDWLCFLDADDTLHSGYLDAMRAVAETDAPPNAAYGLLVPAVQYVWGGKCDGRPRIPNMGGWPKVNECVIGTLIPRRLFQEVGGFRDHLDNGRVLSSLEDYDLFLRCWDAGAQLVYVPDAIYCATISTSGRNADQSAYADIWAEHETRLAVA